MDVIRQLRILCLAALVAAIPACPSNTVSQCEATGILCPSGTHCAAAQPICISDTIRCGDAHVDANEECDDGNNIDGDGCSHLCTVEVCGNHRTDPGEKCDDGNTVSGDGCSADCKSVEVCGNGIIDTAVGEVCDDGNTVSGDGCSADCKSTEVCGNGIKDIHEKCDDGGKPGGCNDDCQGGTGCGDGAIDKDKDGNAIEECDDGNGDSTDDCVACRISRCGDGFKQTTGNRPEICDGSSEPGSVLTGHPVLTANCNLDCTTSTCGDKIVNPLFTPPGAPGPEQCDPPNPGHGCSATCQFEHCGNGIKDPEEECDGTDFGPGGNPDGRTCAADCHIQTCGNGRLDPGEQCDDGNSGSNDGCSGGALAAGGCKIEFCGDGIKNDGTEACDSGVAGIPTAAAGCNANCTTPSCGDKIVNPLFTPTGAPGPEQCDPPDPGHGCSATCQFEHCGNGRLDPGEECDGNDFGPGGNPLGLTCATDCHIQKCGNKRIDPGEQCDDGTGNNGTGKRCNGNCQFNVCGDLDVLNGVEQCDPGHDNTGAPKDTATCDHDCTLAVCGDGIVNAASLEDCDDGPDNGTAQSAHGCDARCRFNSCGNAITDIHEDCDDGLNGTPRNSATCNSDCTLARCGDGFVNNQFKPDGISPEACDNIDPTTHASLNGVPCAYGDPFCTRCNATCTGNTNPGGPFCGDGIRQAGFGEGCDPATGPGPSSPSLLAAADSAICDIDCTPVACGDLHINAIAGEKCDDGNADACGTCPATACNVLPIAAVRATSTVTTVNGDHVGDGDTLKLDDGFGKTITLEFDLGGLQNPNNVSVSFAQAPATDAATIASRMVDAVNTKAPAGFLITASVPTGGTTVTLTNTRKSVFGNTAIGVTGQIGIVGGFTFSASPPSMTGGAVGNCPANIGCASGDDCKSGTCNPTTHKCQ
jgi:cysteine-rich repeat protein